MPAWLESPCGTLELCVDPVGEGASGSVYSATCEALGEELQDVAVKVVRGVSRGGRARTAWRRELRVVRALLRSAHRNVLQYFAAFEYGGKPVVATSNRWNLGGGSAGAAIVAPGDGVLVMERGERIPLPVCARPTPDGSWDIELGWVEAQARWAAQLLVAGANAVCWLHQTVRAIHRDLKLENLLKVDGVIKLADFSAAKMKLYRLQLAGTRAGIGTIGSMAPELYFRGAQYTARVDLWSLGCAVMEAFNGVVPYDIDAFFKLAAQGQVEPPKDKWSCIPWESASTAASEAVDRLQQGIRSRLEAWLPDTGDPVCSRLRMVILKLLSVDPMRRPSAVELLRSRDLQQLAETVGSVVDLPGGAPVDLADEEVAVDTADVIVQMQCHALERIAIADDYTLLRSDVHKALVAGDPAAPEIMQMWLRLPMLRTAPLGLPAGVDHPGGPRAEAPLPGHADAASAEYWSELARTGTARELSLALEASCVPVQRWREGQVERLMEELIGGTTKLLAYREHDCEALLRTVNEFVVVVHCSAPGGGCCEVGESFVLLEMHSTVLGPTAPQNHTQSGAIDRQNPSHESQLPQLRHRHPTARLNPQDGRGWAVRAADAFGEAIATVLPQGEDNFCQDGAPRYELRESESYPGLLTRARQWHVRAQARPCTQPDGGFRTTTNIPGGRQLLQQWAWLTPKRAEALVTQRARLVRPRLSAELSAVEDEEGHTLLHAACLHHLAPRLLRLIAEAAEVEDTTLPLEARDLRGRTPLWVAASRADAEAVRLLLGFRSDPDASDRDGDSPLTVAARTRQQRTLRTLELLLDSGATSAAALATLREADPTSCRIRATILRGSVQNAWRSIEEELADAPGGRVRREDLGPLFSRCDVPEHDSAAAHLLEGTPGACGEDRIGAHELLDCLARHRSDHPETPPQLRTGGGFLDDWGSRVLERLGTPGVRWQRSDGEEEDASSDGGDTLVSCDADDRDTETVNALLPPPPAPSGPGCDAKAAERSPKAHHEWQRARSTSARRDRNGSACGARLTVPLPGRAPRRASHEPPRRGARAGESPPPRHLPRLAEGSALDSGSTGCGGATSAPSDGVIRSTGVAAAAGPGAAAARLTAHESGASAGRSRSESGLAAPVGAAPPAEARSARQSGQRSSPMPAWRPPLASSASSPALPNRTAHGVSWTSSSRQQPVPTRGNTSIALPPVPSPSPLPRRLHGARSRYLDHFKGGAPTSRRRSPGSWRAEAVGAHPALARQTQG